MLLRACYATSCANQVDIDVSTAESIKGFTLFAFTVMQWLHSFPVSPLDISQTEKLQKDHQVLWLVHPTKSRFPIARPRLFCSCQILGKANCNIFWKWSNHFNLLVRAFGKSAFLQHLEQFFTSNVVFLQCSAVKSAKKSMLLWLCHPCHKLHFFWMKSQTNYYYYIYIYQWPLI